MTVWIVVTQFKDSSDEKIQFCVELISLETVVVVSWAHQCFQETVNQYSWILLSTKISHTHHSRKQRYVFIPTSCGVQIKTLIYCFNTTQYANPHQCYLLQAQSWDNLPSLSLQHGLLARKSINCQKDETIRSLFQCIVIVFKNVFFFPNWSFRNIQHELLLPSFQL